MRMVMGLTRRAHCTPEAVLPPSVPTPFLNAQEASELPPPAAEGEALRQEPGPALSRNPWENHGACSLPNQWDHVSKRHFPGCKLGPSDSETQRRTVSSLQMKQVGERQDFAVLFPQLPSDQPPVVDWHHALYQSAMEMLFSASASRHAAGLCHEGPCPARPSPPFLEGAAIPLLRGWGRGMGTKRRQECPKSPRPVLLSEALPSPSSFPGASCTPEIRPGLWVLGLCPAWRPGLLGLPIPTVSPDYSVS